METSQKDLEKCPDVDPASGRKAAGLQIQLGMASLASVYIDIDSVDGTFQDQMHTC